MTSNLLPSHLVPITVRMPSGAGRQCRAFLCVRDEADRLPYLLSYYRKLGVHWFFIVDNGSTDATVDILRAQPDCSVFTTTVPFSEANYGMNWINSLVEAFGTGHWCVFVDADELLVYPHVEELPLPKFCEYLDSQGDEGIYTFMLDMYSEGPVSAAKCGPDQPFLEVCPMFDTGYTFRTRPRLPLRAPPFPPLEVVGGPRLRRFYPEFRDAGAFRSMLPRGITRIRHSRQGQAIGAHRWLKATGSPPLLTKMPLAFGAPGRRWLNNHKVTPLRLSPVTGVLLHCKFFSDFHDRVTKAVEQGQHFDGGSEYGRYASALEADPALCFATPASARYRSSADLTAHGLLRTTADYDSFCAEAAVTRPHASAA